MVPGVLLVPGLNIFFIFFLINLILIICNSISIECYSHLIMIRVSVILKLVYCENKTAYGTALDKILGKKAISLG